MFSHIDKTITEEQNEALSADKSKREIPEAITSMANSKSPGSDGLLPEFYKTFEHLLVNDLLEVYSNVLSEEIPGGHLNIRNRSPETHDNTETS